MSHFQSVKLAPPNPILGLAKEAKADKSDKKIDCTLGAYRDENGKPVVLQSVRLAEEDIHKAKVDHEYLSQDGLESFNLATQILLFGDGHTVVNEKRVHTCQSISGTGSLRLAMDFIKSEFPDVTVYIPSVTWGNHSALLEASGIKVGIYNYLDAAGTGLDFSSMLRDISACPEGSVILLHAIAHNPTGVDPTVEEWDTLRAVVKERKLLPLFDNAYQGFVSGDPHKDAYAVRSYANDGIEMIVACSFAKNFGLYGERTGCVQVVLSDPALVPNVASQLRSISRITYSTCPSFGARIVSTILNSPELNAQWLRDTQMMADRIAEVREALYHRLIELNVKGNWDHVIKQRGMFSFTGIPKDCVDRLKAEFHIYMLGNGRISLAGLNQGNVNYFSECVKEVMGSN
jgi:aspartate aminotransferase, mitochondrial